MDPTRAEELAVIPWVRFPGVLLLVFAAAMAATISSDGRLALLVWSPVILGLAWLGLGFLLNRAHVRLHGDVLEVVHRPIPWPRRSVPRHRVRAVRVFAEQSPDRDTSEWCLEVVTIAGERVRLTNGPFVFRYAPVQQAGRAISDRLGVPIE